MQRCRGVAFFTSYLTYEAFSTFENLRDGNDNDGGSCARNMKKLEPLSVAL